MSLEKEAARQYTEKQEAIAIGTRLRATAIDLLNELYPDIPRKGLDILFKENPRNAPNKQIETILEYENGDRLKVTLKSYHNFMQDLVAIQLGSFPYLNICEDGTFLMASPTLEEVREYDAILAKIKDKNLPFRRSDPEY